MEVARSEKVARIRRPAGKILPFRRRRSDPEGERVLELVAAARGVTKAQLLQPGRGTGDIALSRQLAMYLMHVSLQRIYSEVGVFFERDRKTVSYACSVIEDRRDDPAFEAELQRLEAELAADRKEVGHARVG